MNCNLTFADSPRAIVFCLSLFIFYCSKLFRRLMASPHELKLAISTLNVPHRIKNVTLGWKILEMNQDQWFEMMDSGFDHKPVNFTTGNIQHADLPYWERIRGKEAMSFGEFFEKTKSNCFDQRWASHSYKDIEAWPSALRDSIDFTQLGFHEAKDILFWLGTRGANTPCHYDTYGFNIVVQIFGSKSWLLFPPGSPLKPTRVPFEESSVYCQQNFYSPADGKQFEDLGRNGDVYQVTLNPGDILIVPANWWHYVENLELSLTVNTWIPLETHDAFARLEECFVRTQIEKITESDDSADVDALRDYIFNPNEAAMTDVNLLNLFKPLADIILAKEQTLTTEEDSKAKLIMEEHKDTFCRINPIDWQRFQQIILHNSQRFDCSAHDRSTIRYQDVENVINALCHPRTVRSACDLYLQQIRDSDEK